MKSFLILLAALLLPGDGRSQAPALQWGAYTGNSQESARDFATQLGLAGFLYFNQKGGGDWMLRRWRR